MTALATLTLSFAAVLIITALIIGIFVAVTLAGRKLSLVRYPEQRRDVAEWLWKE